MVTSRTMEQEHHRRYHNMSQSAAPWNADNFGTSNSIGSIKLYNPADFQNNTDSGQYGGSAFQPFPVGNPTITEQPGKPCDTGQQQTPVTGGFQPYNPNTGQPSNQVPPDKESNNQFNQSQTNATMNGSWGWDPSWGEHSNSWFGNSSSNQYNEGDGNFGNHFNKPNVQGNAIDYFDQNQNFPQNAGLGQDSSSIHSQQQLPTQSQQQSQHPMIPQQQQQMMQPQHQNIQPQQQSQQMTPTQHQSQQMMSQQQQPQQMMVPQQESQQMMVPQHQESQQMLVSQHQSQQMMPQQQQPQQMMVPQQDSQQMMPQQQQPQQMMVPQQDSQQMMSQHQSQQMMALQQQSQQHQLTPLQQTSQEGSQDLQSAPLPAPNVPQYLDVATSSALSGSQSEYSGFNDYYSPMSLSTPSIGVASTLSSPSTGQIPTSSDQQFGSFNPNPPSLSWPEVPADSSLNKPSDHYNESSPNPVQHMNMGQHPNPNNYFSAQSVSDQSLWQPTKSVEDNLGQFPVNESASSPELLSTVGSIPLSSAGPISSSALPQTSAWTDMSHNQNQGNYSVPPQQPYQTNSQTTESYFGQGSFLENNSAEDKNSTNSGTIPVDAITQSFSQASISESIPSGVSNIPENFTDISLGNNSSSLSSSQMSGVTSPLLHQHIFQQQTDRPLSSTSLPINSSVKPISAAGDRGIATNPNSNQHSRQSSLGNERFMDGPNNLIPPKTATPVSSSQHVNQSIIESFNLENPEPNNESSLPISKPSISGQPLSVASSVSSLVTPQSTETKFETNDLPSTVNDMTTRQNTSKPPVEATTTASVTESSAMNSVPGNSSVPTLVTSPKLELLHNDHKLNVYASEIQPRDSSPFQPPPPRQGSVDGVHPQSTSRSSSQESVHASQMSRTSGQIHSSSSDGGRSSCGSQSSGTRPLPSLTRQTSHDSTQSVGSNVGSRTSMEKIKEQANDPKIQLPLPSGNKGSSWHDQTSASIRATAFAEARLKECMSPMTTLWDNPQISVSGIHLIPSVPIPSLVAADSITNTASQAVNIATAKATEVENKPKTETPKNQFQLSEDSVSSQPLTSTPNSSVAVTASSHESSPIKPIAKSPTPSVDGTSLSDRDHDEKDSPPSEDRARDRVPRDHDRDRDRDPRNRDPRDRYRDPRDRDLRDRDPRDRDLRDRDPRDPDFRDRDFLDSRDAYDDSRELRDSRREKDYRYMRDYDRDYRSRYRAMDPKDPRYDPYYDRPPSRMDYERFLEYQYYRDEAYDRPRSRQALSLTPSPTSRHNRRDDSDTKSERPLSRAEYARYKHKDMYSDYDPDYYSRNAAYYNYYRDRYTRGGYYDDVDSWYYHDRARRYHRPCYLPSYSLYEEYYGAGTYDGYDNTSHTSREQSRSQTPAQENVSSVMPPHYLHRDHLSAYEQGQDMYDYYYSRGYYGNEEWSAQDEKHDYYKQGRLTPAKFYTPHTCAIFGSGGRLVHVLPNRPVDGQPATVEIINVEDILSDQKEADEFHEFPGPLIRGETHKNDVLIYCQNKAKHYAENMDVIDRESAALLWKFLELLIKQNGTIVGTDIADLLLEGHQPSTADYLATATKLDDELDPTRPPSAQGSDTGTVTTTDKVLINKSSTGTLNERTDRFRNLLLYGMKKDALRWAMKNNLWGHALFLASKMDNRTHADIMTRFANSAIQMNDPLQTLYQLMSGRQPASVTSLCDDNWGDWRPHLAMILSNHSSRPELDKKSITSLGDTLAAKGCLHASHFCYLMAQVNFGTYSKKTSKIVLIGSSHSLPLNEFATNEAIQCTEIFEYAQLLGNSMYLMPSFQPYKLLYACRLADYGLNQEALHYCEVIASTVIQNPVYYQYTVVKVLADISNRLKCYDPQRLQMEDMSDPMWLQQLSNVCQSFEDGSIQPLSGSVTPLGPHVTANSSESGEVAAYLNHTQDSLLPRYPQQMPVGGPYVQNSQLMYNYTQDSYQQYQQQQQQQHQQQQQTYDNSVQQQQQQQQQQMYGENLEYSYATQQQQQPQIEAVPDTTYAYQSQSTSQIDPAAYVSQDAGHQESTNGNLMQQQQQQQMVGPPSMGQSWQPQDQSQIVNQDQVMATGPEEEREMTEDSVSRRASASSIITSTASTTVDSNNTTNMGGFDYFEASTRKTIIPPTRYGANRQRTLSESSNASTGSVKKAPPPTAKKSENLKQKPTDQKSWWNIFSTFGGQRKKDMILPDDKNPSIVWDPDKQRWVNKEEDEEPDVPSAPPPKDIELKSTPAMSAGPPPPNGNMFSRPRARGARSNYVDVMNPTASSQAVPENLFNVLPSTTGAPPIKNIFVPSGSNGTNESNPPSINGQNENDSTSSRPAIEPSAGELSRSSSMSSLSQEVHQLTRKQNMPSSSSSVSVQQPMPAAPASGPMLYNPASFQNQSFSSGPSALGPTSRLAQRRVYPK